MPDGPGDDLLAKVFYDDGSGESICRRRVGGRVVIPRGHILNTALLSGVLHRRFFVVRVENLAMQTLYDVDFEI